MSIGIGGILFGLMLLAFGLAVVAVPVLIVVALVRSAWRMFRELTGIHTDGRREIAGFAGGNCPHAGCGNDNLPGARFCTRCGRPMPGQAERQRHG